MNDKLKKNRITLNRNSLNMIFISVPKFKPLFFLVPRFVFRSKRNSLHPVIECIVTSIICIKIQCILHNDYVARFIEKSHDLRRNSIIEIIYRYMHHLSVPLSCLKIFKIHYITE
jgi:hypothetical protein